MEREQWILLNQWLVERAASVFAYGEDMFQLWNMPVGVTVEVQLVIGESVFFETYEGGGVIELFINGTGRPEFYRISDSTMGRISQAMNFEGLDEFGLDFFIYWPDPSNFEFLVSNAPIE